uniref:Uncharacterized protein n=1 Tax=Parascaris equorum TaxID=6256 RepID=A0A914RHM3_PAREQ
MEIIRRCYDALICRQHDANSDNSVEAIIEKEECTDNSSKTGHYIC